MRVGQPPNSSTRRTLYKSCITPPCCAKDAYIHSATTRTQMSQSGASAIMPLTHSVLVMSACTLLLQVTNAPPSPAQETWPATWRYSSLGKAGLALLGLAFLIATCIQLQGVLSKQWHKDYRCAVHSEAAAQHAVVMYH